LDASATRGLSSKTALELLSPFGWRVATFAEVNGLLLSNLPQFSRGEDFEGGVALSSDGADTSLTRLIGVLGGPSWEDGNSYELFVNTGVETSPGWFAFTCLQHYEGMTAIANTFCSAGRDKAYATTGTWFVSENTPVALPSLPSVPAVPEPQTSLLALGGLMAVAALVRRKRNLASRSQS
jgi:hypothetical protein